MEPRYFSLLLVEDDQELREVLERRLVRRGYQVIPVFCADGARAAFAEQAVDVVLMDRGIHGSDGLRLAREFKLSAPAVQIVILSGRIDDPSTPPREGTEIFAYLSKPCSLQQLEQTIEAACQKRAAVLTADLG